MRQVMVKAGLARCCKSLTETMGSYRRSLAAQKICWTWIVVTAAGQDSGLNHSQIGCQIPCKAHSSVALPGISHPHLSSIVSGLPNQSHILLCQRWAALSAMPLSLSLPSVKGLRKVEAITQLSPPETSQTRGKQSPI